MSVQIYSDKTCLLLAAFVRATTRVALTKPANDICSCLRFRANIIRPHKFSVSLRLCGYSLTR
jgi:hypothetical protein